MPRVTWSWTVLVFSLIEICTSTHLPCSEGKLALYNVLMVTNWTKDLFPKQYPEWRPPAQWSRVVGQTHDAEYRLFQLGLPASQMLKLFVETGKQEILGNLNSTNHILDEFLLPEIKQGAGTSMSAFFVDSNHSRVSMVARIIPSPDWFVGVDSINLCADGHWVDTITVEGSPIDAGTDNGFTFSAPNWATDPQEAIYKITSQYPRHPANSFYYPNLPDLPPIATFHLTKKKIFHEAAYTQEENNEPSTTLELIMPQLSKSTNTQNAVVEASLFDTKASKKKARKKKRSKSEKGRKQCLVGEWSDWTACNAPCGQSIRRRNVTRNGLLCPPLLQERTCGCTKYIFNW